MDKSIMELSVLIKNKEVSPVTLVEECLSNIERLEPELHSFITVTADFARKKAKEAEKEIQEGNYRGPLHGIPYAAKDLFATKGILTTDGSELHSEVIPDFDATTIRLLDEAGAVLVGKTNLDEFAYGGGTDNDYFGDSYNPWNTKRIPGGSSGGSGASVVARTSCFSLGTDTGGSVRVPASMCGVVGIKPTYGRVSRYGVTVLSPSFDHVGIFAKSTEECALVLGILAGEDENDKSSSSYEVPDYTSELKPLDLSEITIGVCPQVYEGTTDIQVQNAYLKAVEYYKEKGAKIVEVMVPGEGGEFEKPDLRQAVIAVEAYAYHARDLEQKPEKYSKKVRDRILLGQFYPGHVYVNAQRWRSDFINQWEKLYDEIDLFMMPTTPVTGYEARTNEVDFNGKKMKLQKNLKIGVFTTISNQNGFPAISVPCGFSSEGMPIGFQIQGLPFNETLIMQAAMAYEKENDYSKIKPAICS